MMKNKKELPFITMENSSKLFKISFESASEDVRSSGIIFRKYNKRKCWVNVQFMGDDSGQPILHTYDVENLSSAMSSPKAGIFKDLIYDMYGNKTAQEIEEIPENEILKLKAEIRRVASYVMLYWDALKITKKSKVGFGNVEIINKKAKLKLPHFGFTEHDGEKYLTELTYAYTDKEADEQERIVLTLKLGGPLSLDLYNFPAYYTFETGKSVHLPAEWKYWMMTPSTLIEIQDIFSGKATAPTFDEGRALLNIVDIHTWHFEPHYRLLHYTWVLGTWFFELFECFPELNLMGPSDSGKTVACTIITATAYHPSNHIEPTDAAIFRDSQCRRGTLIIDENDSLANADSRFTLMRLLRAAYSKHGGMVPRVENEDDVHVVREYPLYRPVCSSGIQGLEGILESRSIPLSITRKPNDIREYYQANPTQYEDFVQLMYKLRFARAKEVLAVKERLMRDGIHPKIKGRQADLWLPIMTMAELFCNDEEKLILLDFAVMIAEAYKSDPKNIPEAEMLLYALASIFEGDRYYKVGIITKTINSENFGWVNKTGEWSEEKTGKVLQRLGFVNSKRLRVKDSQRRPTARYVKGNALRVKMMNYLGLTSDEVDALLDQGGSGISTEE